MSSRMNLMAFLLWNRSINALFAKASAKFNVVKYRFQAARERYLISIQNSTGSVRMPRMFNRFTNLHVANEFVEVIITEVIAFALYAVLTNAIVSANLTGALKGTNGILTGLVTLFYILAAALLPYRIVKRAMGK